MFPVTSRKIIQKRKKMPDSKLNELSLRDFYEQYWHCRDFEINNLWQRSIFLGTFLVLCFTGYGVFFTKAFFCGDGVLSIFTCCNLNDSIAYKHCIACFIALIGVVFSLLWIAMAKASKAWVEVYEQSIVAIEKKMTKGTVLDDIAGFQYVNLEEYVNVKTPKFDRKYYSQKGGAFSPSKINIAIGQISFCIWVMISVIHFLCCVSISFIRDSSFYYDNLFICALYLFFFFSSVLYYKKRKLSGIIKFESDNLLEKDPNGIATSNMKIINRLYHEEKAFLREVLEASVWIVADIVEKQYYYAEKNIVFCVYEMKDCEMKIDVSVRYHYLNKVNIVLKNKNNEDEPLYSKTIECSKKEDLFSKIEDCFSEIREIYKELVV